MLITNLPLLDERQPSLNVEPVRGMPALRRRAARRCRWASPRSVHRDGVRRAEYRATTMRSKGLGSIRPESSSTGSTRLLVCFVEGPTSGNQHGIPRSRHDPKILGGDDAEVVGD